MRTLPSAAATAAALKTGSYPIRVLQINYGSGSTLYFSDRDVSPTSGVEAIGAVKSWGELRLEPEPGQVGGFGQFTCTLRDLDWTLFDLEAVQPGIQTADCTLWLWFVGTDWDTDKVNLFSGTMAPQQFTVGQEEVTLTIRGLEAFWDKDLGYRITSEDFPTIKCSECDGLIIPIAFGDPVYRVPACPIVQPARARLAYPLGICDTQCQITEEASTLGFPVGEDYPIELAVGVDGDYDVLTGYFTEADETIFIIQDRLCFHGKGATAGVYITAGTRWVTIDKADLDDSGAKDMRGYPLIFFDYPGTGECVITIVSHWDDVPDPNELAIWPDSAGEFPTSESPSNPEWAILNRLTIPFYPAGTEVMEIGDWTYAINFLPIEGVDRVEVKGTDEAGNVVFYTVSSYVYEVNEDDNQLNESHLGRASDDPGIATITLLGTSPIQEGFSDDIIYVTFRATIPGDNNPLLASLSAGEAISEPAAAIAEIASNPFLGNISNFQMDALQDAFDNTVISIAFAILEQRGLWEVIGEIAKQSGLLVFVDGGNLVVKRILTTQSSGDFASDNDNRHKASLKCDPRDLLEMPQEMVGRYRPSLGDEEQRIVRYSTDARLAISRNKSREMEFWAIQSPTGVAYMTQWWLTHELTRNRRFDFEQFMDFLAAQPGDMVDLTHYDIDSEADPEPETAERINTQGRIISVTHVPGNAQSRQMEMIRLTIECHEWEYDIAQGPEPYECGVMRSTVESPPPTVYTEEPLGLVPGGPNFYPQVITAENAETILCGDNCDDVSPSGGSGGSGGGSSASGDECDGFVCSVNCVDGSIVVGKLTADEAVSLLTQLIESANTTLVDDLKTALGIS